MIRIFSHYISLNTLLVAIFELVLLALLVAISVLVATEFLGTKVQDSLVLTSLLLSLAIVFGMSVLGLYAQPGVEGWRGIIFRLPAAMVVGVMVFIPLQMLYFDPPLLEFEVLGTALALGFAVIVLERSLVLRFTRLSWLCPRVLVMGTGSRANVVERLTQVDPGVQGFELIGFVPVKEVDHSVPERFLVPWDEHETLSQLAERHGATDIVVGIRERRDGGMPTSALLECKLAGFRVTELSSFFEKQIGQIRLDSLNASWLIFGEGFRQNRLRSFNKRLFDIVASIGLLIVTLPILVLTALLIVLTMGRPIFYRQQRVGQNGKPYSILKFRSMRNDAEVGGAPQWATQTDPRVTPVGRVIRKLRIDELPQIFNVLRGDMSFVGPRPERPEFVDELSEKIPYYDCRHSIKPGITGWAQVRYPYGASIDDAREKLQYDLYYVKNHTLFLDCMILLDTVQVVLYGKGAR